MIKEYQLQLYMIKLFFFVGIGNHANPGSTLSKSLEVLDRFDQFDRVSQDGSISFRFVTLSRVLYSARMKRGER